MTLPHQSVSAVSPAALQPGRVSVMMPAFNAERFIKRAIDSVVSQTYKRIGS